MQTRAIVAWSGSGFLLAAASCGETQAVEASGLAFVDVAAEAGIDVEVVSGDPRRWYIPESNGSGAGWLDYDSDGDQDLFVGNGKRLRYVDDGKRLEIIDGPTSRLYRNDSSDGTWSFADVSAETGMAREEWVNAVTVGDVDGDGFPDVYLGCFGADALLRNNGGVFELDTRLANAEWAAGAVFGDADGDGNLDLFVANYVQFDLEAPPLGGKRAVYDGVEVGWGPEVENKQGFNLGAPNRFYVGDGQGGFEDVTAERGLALEKPFCSYAAVFTDFDLDGDQDLAVANDLQPSNLFLNAGDARFAEVGAERGFAVEGSGKATAGMGLAFADVDRDGDFDCLRTNFDFEANTLLINDGAGHFRDRTQAAALGEPSLDKLGWAAAFFDAELDGDLDLMVANGHVLPQSEQVGMSPWAMQTQLFEAVGTEDALRYAEVGEASGLAGAYAARAIALCDADEDGDLDAVVVDLDGPPRLLENRSARRGHWISVRLRGTDSNRNGLGAKVSVIAGDGIRTHEVRRTNGLYSSHDPRAHFGLGLVDEIHAVEVAWPSGTLQRIESPPLDAVLTVREASSLDR